MPVAADYPLLEIMWTMLLFFVFVMWIFLLFRIIVDVFRRNDISGWLKAGWTLFIIVLPLLGVLVYLIAQGTGMTERDMSQVKAQQSQMDDYVRSVSGGAGGAAAEIESAKGLLDSGAVTQDEFAAIKAKALA
jgi:hypothetical protein